MNMKSKYTNTQLKICVIFCWQIYVFDNHGITLFHASITQCVSDNDFAVKLARQDITPFVLEIVKNGKNEPGQTSYFTIGQQ